MDLVLGVCGCICSDCRLFPKKCAGCYACEGKVCWLHEVGLDICDFYACAVKNHHIIHCGYCDQIPCEKFFKNKNPEWTEEQHLEIVKARVHLLQKDAQI